MNNNDIIHAESVFHNVGQGLFYSGRIHLGHMPFNFVYDCGTHSKRQYMYRAIDSYKERIENGRLNLLVISHFDEDHVNGLDYLLKKLRVNQVVIPYLTPIERLIIALRYTASRNDAGNETPEAWYYDFLSDPVSYLTNKVEQIIIVGGGAEAVEVSKNYTFDEKFPKEKYLDFAKMEDDKKLKMQINELEPEWLKNSNILIKNHSEGVPLSNHWLFKFFNYKIEAVNLEKFHKCLENMGIKPNSDAIKDTIINREKRRTFRRCYSKLGITSNDSSLVLYHGPIDSPSVVNISCRSCGFCCGKYHTYYRWMNFYDYDSTIFGHLLTGDTDLNNKKNTDLLSHFDEFKNKIKIVQVPHHGSVANWNYCTMRKLLGVSREPVLYCASAGIMNRYGHPSPDVVDEIHRIGCLYWCNEHNRVTINGKLYF